MNSWRILNLIESDNKNLCICACNSWKGPEETHPLDFTDKETGPESLSNSSKNENKLEAEAGIEPFNLLYDFVLMFYYYTLSPV